MIYCFEAIGIRLQIALKWTALIFCITTHVAFPKGGTYVINYRISSYSFRGNYSFLNLTLCTVTFNHSTYRWGNYSREETIQGRKLYEKIRYVADMD